MVAGSKKPWSGFPNPLVSSLAHPGGLGNPPPHHQRRWPGFFPAAVCRSLFRWMINQIEPRFTPIRPERFSIRIRVKTRGRNGTKPRKKLPPTANHCHFLHAGSTRSRDLNPSMAWLYDCASRVRCRVPVEQRLYQAGRSTVWPARNREEHGYRAYVARLKRRVPFGLTKLYTPLEPCHIRDVGFRVNSGALSKKTHFQTTRLQFVLYAIHSTRKVRWRCHRPARRLDGRDHGLDRLTA